MHLRTLVIVRITIWSFLASLLGTHKLSIDVKKYQQAFLEPLPGKAKVNMSTLCICL
jgi:hypothetical protein